MKKHTKRIVLKRETLQNLKAHNLGGIVGGSDGTVGPDCSHGCGTGGSIVIIRATARC